MSTSGLIFFLAITLSVGALTPLALPLLGMAKDAIRLRSLGADEVAPGARSELEVELSVRGRLYPAGTNASVTHSN